MAKAYAPIYSKDNMELEIILGQAIYLLITNKEKGGDLYDAFTCS